MKNKSLALILFAFIIAVALPVMAVDYASATNWGVRWSSAAIKHWFNGPVKFGSEVVTAYGVGAKNGTGVTVAERGTGVTHQTVFTFAAASLTSTDATTNGAYGSLKIYDFPAGMIVYLGGSCNLTTLAGSGGITDTAAVVSSLGTVTAAADDTLTSTEANFIASTAGTLSSGAGTFAGAGNGTMTQFDGHTTPIDLYLNFAMVDAGSTADDTLAYTGTCTVNWMNAGDY